jgi:methyltransferase
MFFVTIFFLIFQRLIELVLAKRNTARLLAAGAREFGREHYPIIVGLHIVFFASLVAEYSLTSAASIQPFFLIVLLLSQIGRVWVLTSLKGRWTTRVLVVPGEKLVSSGPYKHFRHPNYVIVAVEIAVIPLAFNLLWTALVFSILNAIVLLTLRIPVEETALAWSQEQAPASN